MAHLTYEQRYTISVLLQRGSSLSEIGRTIGRDKSVVCREIKRNSSPVRATYSPRQAQLRAERRQKYRHRHRRLTAEVIHFIEDKIREDYSPEQVVGYAKRHNIPCVSITTIYKYIWTDKNHYCSSHKLFHHLRIVRKKAIRRCGQRNRLGIIPEREMIDLRPEIVEQRTRFGDFEADTMWIADKAVIVTVNDRATGLSFIKQLPNRKTDLVNKTIHQLLKPFIGQIKTITVDNGKEFYKHKQLAQMLNTKVYFAQPYCSWQRGSNENTNGLYRQYFPRNTKLESLTDEYINQIMTKLNNRPRKRLNFLSPIEFFITNFNSQSLHL